MQDQPRKAVREIDDALQDDTSGSGNGITSLFIRITDLGGRVQTFHDRLLKPEGVILADYYILCLLLLLGPRSSKALNEFLQMTTAGVTNALDRLERRGWVRRRPNPNDGRSVEVTLTAGGRSKARRLADIERRAQAEVLGAVSMREQAKLIKALDRLVQLLGG